MPRVIVPEHLDTTPREKERIFPTSESSSVALYLGLKLAENGGVAIYVRMPGSASKLVRDVAREVFPRNPSFDSPAKFCDSKELNRLVHLLDMNFGDGSYLTEAARLGVFAHHGNTPHGARLAIEHAMRKSHIRLIVCTSTLAQGVNLPIRYLLVTAAMQGKEVIKARDFHNLIGRAGRAGMYGEGTILFSDPALFDQQDAKPERWNAAQALLSKESAEDTSSSLLNLLAPIENESRTRILVEPSAEEIVQRLIDAPDELFEELATLDNALLRVGFKVDGIQKQLRSKRKFIDAIESFLMAHDEAADEAGFISVARELARETFAHSLASKEQQDLLEGIFQAIARNVADKVPVLEDRVRYGRTLFGVDVSRRIDQWVGSNKWELEVCASEEELLDTLWPFLLSLSSDNQLRTLEPERARKRLAKKWLSGMSFGAILSWLKGIDAYVPQKTRKLKPTEDMVVGFCEKTLGYELGLYIAAMKSSFENAVDEGHSEDVRQYFDLLQKRLKYGLPNQDTISYHEVGFAERVVAQAVAAEVLWEAAQSPADARRLLRKYGRDVRDTIEKFPSYFVEVFEEVSQPSARG